MLGFVWWWAWLLIPLPLLVRHLLPVAVRAQTALYVPLLTQSDIPRSSFIWSSNRFIKILVWGLWICLVAAASRPYWLDEPIALKVSGRDMVLAVDVSGSMQEADMFLDNDSATRIDVLKNVAGDFINRREGDRLSLVLFGSKAYVYVPLTFDLQTLNELLQGIDTGLAGRRTAIGDAIGVALGSLQDQKSKHKVLILITDGNNTAGISDPLKAANAARQQGLTIYTIGIGIDAETMRRKFGVERIPPGTALDEANLMEIARITDGRYFRANDTLSLRRIYAELDLLEPVEREDRAYRPRLDLFHIPLTVGILILLLYMVWAIRKYLVIGLRHE